MKTKIRRFPALSLAVVAMLMIATAFAAPGGAVPFEGRITATVTRGGETETLLFTVATNQMRIERGEGDRPYPVDIFDRASGGLTLLFPNNRSFVRLRSSAENHSRAPVFPAMPGMTMPPGVRPPLQSPTPTPGAVGPTNLPGIPQMPQMPQMPPGVGPQAGALGAMPNGAAGTPALPAMPMMPPMMMEKTELSATGDKTNLLGYACQKFEIKQRGEVMEIWGTDQLLPFQPYLQNQPHRFGPRMIEERWGDLLKAKKLFPVLAVLRFEAPAAPGQTAPHAGPERLRFEVKSVTLEKIGDKDGGLFQPPADYHELEPLPF